MKYIFFDIDGTLIDSYHGKKEASYSTKKTIKKLKEKGHIVGIATGRQMSHALPVCKQLEIDNLVSDGGNGLIYKGIKKYIHPLEEEICIKLSQELLAKHIPFAYVTNPTENKVYATEEMLAITKRTYMENLEVIIDNQFDYQKAEAYKIYIAITKEQEDLIETINVHNIMKYVDDCIAFEPDDKYQGIKSFIELDHGDINDLIYFGDGLNDLSMFQQIPFSIAMGNAIEEIKQLSYFITKDIQDDGIEYACQYFKLI